jgi:hypothetical protein
LLSKFFKKGWEKIESRIMNRTKNKNCSPEKLVLSDLFLERKKRIRTQL